MLIMKITKGTDFLRPEWNYLLTVDENIHMGVYMLNERDTCHVVLFNNKHITYFRKPFYDLAGKDRPTVSA